MSLLLVKAAFEIYDRHSQQHNYDKQYKQKHINRKLVLYTI